MTTEITVLVETLRANGIDAVFGVPGTQSVPLFEEFRRAGIRTILATDELAAAFMANGYFRASGRIAALATISGPGFTYALTGLAEARHDSVGLLHLVSTPRADRRRAFQLQAIDQRTIAGPLVKGYLLLDGSVDVAVAVHQAVELATAGEPGPVIVELDATELADRRYLGGGTHTPTRAGVSAQECQHLADRFEKSRYPVFLLGSGATGAREALASIAHRLRIPIVTTPSARGLIREDDVMVMCYDPLRGTTDQVNGLFAESDLILGLGCKLTHNGSAGYRLQLHEKLVHVDAEPGVLGANYKPDLAICARVEEITPFLTSRTSTSSWQGSQLLEFRDAIRRVTPEPEPLILGPSGSMPPAQFFSWLRTCLSDDAIVVTDSGLHQVLTRKYYEVRAPRGLVFPSDFQSMGFGLPAAVGARVAAPERDTVVIVGDGGFLMSGLEIMTAQREGLPIVVIVFNDGQLNQIRLQQLGEFGRSHAVRLANPDYQRLAAAFGVEYVRFDANSLRETENLLRGKRRPLLMEVAVGDSVDLRVRTSIALTKRVGRKIISPGLRAWIKARLGQGATPSKLRKQ
jgi:acetolactate synthase-1/2/3 large subunit